MSLKIIKAGLLDTIQDQGRYGFQHLGINPSGAMDPLSSKLANALLGNEFNEAVIEMHFPAAEIQFDHPTVIVITGADFSPAINAQTLPLNQPVLVNRKRVLKFTRLKSGARCYLAVLNGFKIDTWLNSYSTNLKAGAGGWKGRKLLKGDDLPISNQPDISESLDHDFIPLRWGAVKKESIITNEVRYLKGSEWDWLDNGEDLQKQEFVITKDSDRMAFRLSGKELNAENKQLISSPVTFGTIQLLPNGQLIVLMADHQTTGGYPRIGHVISADLPILAQLAPGNNIRLLPTDLQIAEKAMLEEHQYLRDLQAACAVKMKQFYATL